MSYGKEHEIRCFQCDFLIGFQEQKETADHVIQGTCIYCISEREFFRTEFSGSSSGNQSIYGTIETDKSHYRRGLMHDRKIAIALWRELIEDPDVKFD